MKSSEFLRAWFGGARGWIVLWRSDTKASTWCESADDADIYAAEARAENFDAYFGTCLQLERVSGRGAKSGVSVVPGLWVDVDFADKPNQTEAAKKKNYPPRAVAEKVIAGMPAAPSYVVETGGGIHVYWRFDAPFYLNSEADHERIQRVVSGWQGMLRAGLMKAGSYGIDSTHDLSRVLRLPDSVHTKHPGFAVSVAVNSGLTYSVESIESWLMGGAASLPATKAPVNGKPAKVPVNGKPAKAPAAVEASVVIATEASDPPGTKLVNMLEAIPEFKSLWDGKTKRPSPSEYDMSLANYAINSGWSDQDAAALLVAFARRHNPSHLPKLLRVTGGVQDYLKITLAKAHKKRVESAESESANQSIDELAIAIREAQQSGVEVDRKTVLEKVSEAFGVSVVGFRQTGRRDEVYSLLVKNGNRTVEVAVGNAAAVMSGPQRVCERILAECGVLVRISPKLKKEWASILAGLISIREFHDLQELELSARVVNLIEEHLLRCSGGYWVDSPATRNRLVSRSAPFVEEGWLYVAGSPLKKLAGELDRSIAGAELYVGLRGAGFEQVNVSTSTNRTSRSYWKGASAGFSVASAPAQIEAERAAEAALS